MKQKMKHKIEQIMGQIGPMPPMLEPFVKWLSTLDFRPVARAILRGLQTSMADSLFNTFLGRTWAHAIRLCVTSVTMEGGSRPYSGDVLAMRRAYNAIIRRMRAARGVHGIATARCDGRHARLCSRFF